MSGKRQRTRAQHETGSSRTGHRPSTGGVGRRSVTTAKGLSTTDRDLVRRVLDGEKQKKGRWLRCITCGHQFPPDELHQEFDEEGRRLGWVCDGCF